MLQRCVSVRGRLDGDSVWAEGLPPSVQQEWSLQGGKVWVWPRMDGRALQHWWVHQTVYTLIHTLVVVDTILCTKKTEINLIKRDLRDRRGPSVGTKRMLMASNMLTFGGVYVSPVFPWDNEPFKLFDCVVLWDNTTLESIERCILSAGVWFVLCYWNIFLRWMRHPATFCSALPHRRKIRSKLPTAGAWAVEELHWRQTFGRRGWTNKIVAHRVLIQATPLQPSGVANQRGPSVAPA